MEEVVHGCARALKGIFLMVFVFFTKTIEVVSRVAVLTTAAAVEEGLSRLES